jgi:hypothetical protein
MTHSQIVSWLLTNKPNTTWRVAGDFNSQADVDANMDWMESTPKPTYADLTS